MQYTPYFISHSEEFTVKPNPNFKGWGTLRNLYIPKDNCSKEGLQSIYRYEVEVEDEFVTDNIPEMLQRMVEKFKASDCYKAKSEQERQEIIAYIMQHPEDN